MAQITACSTLGFCNCSIDQAARQIAIRGFEKIEIAHMGTYCRHYVVGKEDPLRVAQLFAELGMSAVAMNYSTGWSEEGKKVTPNLANPRDAEIVESTVQQLLRDLSVIGVPLLTIPVGRRTEAPDRRERVQASAKVISRLGDFAADLGIRLTLEVPHCYDLHNNLERVADIFSLVTSPNVGALIDTSHWTVLKYNLEEWYRVVSGRLWHVHLRDARGDDTADFKQQLEFTAGRGECNFSSFGDWLDSHGYLGEVSVEFEYRDPAITLTEIETEYDSGLQFLSRSGWTLPSGIRFPS